ncbi:1787_t:CDS:2 [Paraglomus brasilianum]|uniref:1787_t:CDS:1 n=1 Tax=Paraglomus brasilianum TaxID=144538 RepID=A0A9N9AKR7_9GLOM|nr:1787_t:CDS:2 [Paraglomus brasilianum]
MTSSDTAEEDWLDKSVQDKTSRFYPFVDLTDSAEMKKIENEIVGQNETEAQEYDEWTLVSLEQKKVQAIIHASTSHSV